MRALPVARHAPTPWPGARNQVYALLPRPPRTTTTSLAPLFLDAARAFLSIQASSASAERLFGDARYQKGIRRQGTGSPATEMLLMVRSYVVAHLNSPSRQTGFIGNRAQAVKELAEAIATELEEWNY